MVAVVAVVALVAVVAAVAVITTHGRLCLLQHHSHKHCMCLPMCSNQTVSLQPTVITDPMYDNAELL